MTWELSDFGKHLCGGSGIGELMEDLGHAIAMGGDNIRMLGGGQPAHIPEMDALWRRRLEEICAESGQLEHMLGNYEPPTGNPEFLRSIATLFRREFDWDIGPENVAVTFGGQTAFFFLFNALAGYHKGDRHKKVLLPLVPEYIGYANQSLGSDIFRAIKPRIELIGDHDFKYRVDFNALRITDDIAAICVSRPTNPTGNVLTDSEIDRLAELARQHDIPLMIDNAYGAPFPNAIFTDATPLWNDQIVLTLSLSKLGLPGTRTGIVIARPSVIEAIGSMTSIVGLANSNVGQAIVRPLIDSGDILRLSNEVILPYYRNKSDQARGWVDQYFDASLPYRIHLSEGAFFLWLWCEGMPITSRDLYERLKKRGVLVVPGNYFFFGLEDEEWKHRDECLRVSFTMPDAVVEDGIRVIAEEVAKAYRQAPPAAKRSEVVNLS